MAVCVKKRSKPPNLESRSQSRSSKWKKCLALQLLWLTCLGLAPSAVDSAKILFISHDHIVSFEPLAHRLADADDGRRHEVTIVSPLTMENHNPKIAHFCPPSVLHLHREYMKLGQVKSLADKKVMDTLRPERRFERALNVCREFYQSSEFKQCRWTKGEDCRFDLVITDFNFKECALPLAHVCGAKAVVFGTSPMKNWEMEIFGFSDGVGDSELRDGSEKQETQNQYEYFKEHFAEEWNKFKWHFWRWAVYLPEFDRMVKEKLGGVFQAVPRVTELEKNVALFLMNSHYPHEVNESLAKFFVPVGGMHCKETNGKITDKGIQKYIEDPKADGFIFISFGSFLKISTLNWKDLEIFFDTFDNFPNVKFLWKWEGPTPKGLPKNVLLSRWFQQQQLLSHRKCLGFITNGGFLSYQQAIFHGVPLLVIPFTDEHEAVEKSATFHGIGVGLKSWLLNAENFTQAIYQLLTNQSYTENAKKLSKLTRDLSSSPVETAVRKVEYVLGQDRKTLQELRPPDLGQHRLLQLLIALFVAILLALYILFVILKAILGKLFKSFPSSSSKVHSNAIQTPKGNKKGVKNYDKPVKKGKKNK